MQAVNSLPAASQMQKPHVAPCPFQPFMLLETPRNEQSHRNTGLGRNPDKVTSTRAVHGRITSFFRRWIAFTTARATRSGLSIHVNNAGFAPANIPVAIKLGQMALTVTWRRPCTRNSSRSESVKANAPALLAE